MTEKLEKALKEAIASLNVEEMDLPQDGEEIILKRLRGEISEEEFLAAAAKIAKNE